VFVNGLFSLLSGSGASGKLSTLAFHKVPKDQEPLLPNELQLGHFEQVLAFLTTHFRVLPLSEAVERLRHGRLPARAVSITFDDGYGEWLNGVSAVLRKYDAPATFFIVTEQLRGRALWNERILAAVRALPPFGARLPPGLEHLSSLSALIARQRLVAALVEQLTHCDLETRLGVIADLESQAIIPLHIASPFSESQVLELHRQGFEIGAHTERHPILNKCSQTAARDEIGASRERLEALTRSPVTLFAYPNGRPNVDFSPDHVRLVRECGYRAAVTTAWGVATKSTDPFLLPRFTPWSREPWRIALQLMRNMSTAARGPEWWGWRPRKQLSRSRPLRVMTVENGAGFGGAIVALEALLQGLSKANVEVYVISNYPVGRFASIPVVREHKVLSDRHINFSLYAQRLCARGEGSGIWRRVMLFGLGRLDDLVNRLPYLLALLAEIYRIRPDIIHGNNTPLSNREAIIAARVSRIAYVQHVRGPVEPGRKMSWMLDEPHAFVPVSKWLELTLLKRGVEPSRVSQIYDALPSYIAPATAANAYFRAELGLPAHATVVAMIGMLLSWKGQELFLDAVSDVIDRFPKAYFLVIGGTPEKSDLVYEQSLQRRISEMGNGKRILMTGMRDDVFRLLPEVDAVVSASLDPEPLGLVMLEAMMAGKMFIGPEHGAATEIVRHGHNGLLFRPGDHKSLAQTLEAFLLEQIPVQSIAARGQDDIRRNFHPSAQAKAFTQLLQCLMRRP
jgi:peptidoglycan/xylan/chitin deacetylase (PgdA/CDA1 family)